MLSEVGYKFKGKTARGKMVTIWRDADNNYGQQMWRWSAVYDDGSGREFDWGTSYAGVRKQIPHIIGKMKRVK